MKKIVLFILVVFIFGVFGNIGAISSTDYENLISEQKELENELSSIESLIQEKNEEILELEQEKELALVAAAKKVEEEKLASEAAAKAQEEAKKQETASTQTAGSSTTQSSSNQSTSTQSSSSQSSTTQSEATQQSEAVVNETSQMVWIKGSDATIYHSSSTCSRMKTPTQITLEKANTSGMRACQKCY